MSTTSDVPIIVHSQHAHRLMHLRKLDVHSLLLADDVLQSIMPLQHLVKALLGPWSSTLDLSDGYPLHGIIGPLLLTPRSASEKYHSRIAQLVSEERQAQDSEERLMWFKLNNEKPADNGAEDLSHDEDAAEDKRVQQWLERMERREYVSLRLASVDYD